MSVLVACEESQAVCKAFRERGIEAWSCDIQECSGGHPEWHICCDVLPLLNGNCSFFTQDGHTHTHTHRWDLIIAHPPCTYLTTTANSWYRVEKWGEAAYKRQKERYKAIVFFMAFVYAECKHIAIENPVGVINTAYRYPDCIVHPYYFGDDAKKKTCFWLKNLPPLRATNMITPSTIKTGHGTDSPWHAITWNLPPKERAKARSKTYPGIAAAMADQWGAVIKNERLGDDPSRPAEENA